MKSEQGIRDWEEVEYRTRSLARLERIWGRSGVANGSAAGTAHPVSSAGEERERRTFSEALRDGFVLCQLLNKLRASTVVRPDPKEDGFKKTSNVTKFLAACASYGLSHEDLFQRDDLTEATSESLARVAHTIIALIKFVESPVPSRSKYMSGQNQSAAKSGTRSPYGTLSGVSASTPNLVPSSPSSPTPNRKPWSPRTELPSVRSYSPEDSLSAESAKAIRQANDSNSEWIAGEGDGDELEVKPMSVPLLGKPPPPPKSPLRKQSSRSHDPGGLFTWAKNAAAPLPSPTRSSHDATVREPTRHSRQSMTSSVMTETTMLSNAPSSLLDAGRRNSSNNFGTIRTVTTDLTSEAPSISRAEGNSIAEGLSRKADLPLPPLSPPPKFRDRRSSELHNVDLSRVAEETDDSLSKGSKDASGSSGGDTATADDRPRLRGRFQSDVESSSVRRGSPASHDDWGNGRGMRARFESMVHLGVSANGASASDLLSRSSLDGSSARSLMVKEDGKPPIHFQLGNCIGRGQFGSVYRALNLNTGQTVAVKRIRLEGLKEEEVTQLMKEVELVKNLSHPSIVKYEGMARDDDHLSIVLEYAENGSLAQTLKAFGKLNEKLVASYVVKILEGLHYLHTSDVVHCDLKAANILTTKNGNVKLSDFGVSLNLRAMEREIKDVAGTPNWMAPEVIELKGASTKSDIWSLGCTVVELLTGRPPYADIANSMSVMFRIVEDKTVPLPDGCSDLLEDFLRQCFQKDPSSRPSAELLCEHPWLKANWRELGDLRPQDSIPFLRRVSTDIQKTDVVRYLSQMDMQESPVSEGYVRGDAGKVSPIGRRSSTTSVRPLPENDISPREHSFVKTTFSKPMMCRVCLLNVKKSAVLCAQCSLISHAKCAINAPPTCDLRAQLLLYAQYAERDNPSSVYSNPVDLLGEPKRPGAMSDVPYVAHSASGRTDNDTPPPPSPAPHVSESPPTAYKFMAAFKRSRSNLTPEPQSRSPSSPPQSPSHEERRPRRTTVLQKRAERPQSVMSDSTGVSSLRSAATAAESMSSRHRSQHSSGGRASKSTRFMANGGLAVTTELEANRSSSQLPSELSTSSNYQSHSSTKASGSADTRRHKNTRLSLKKPPAAPAPAPSASASTSMAYRDTEKPPPYTQNGVNLNRPVPPLPPRLLPPERDLRPSASTSALSAISSSIPDPPATVNQVHLVSKKEDIIGTFFVDPRIPTLSPKHKRKKHGKRGDLPHASFQTRSGGISLALATTGNVKESPNATVNVASRSGCIEMRLVRFSILGLTIVTEGDIFTQLPTPPSRPRIGVDARSRSGDITIWFPETFSGVIQLNTVKGELHVLPNLAKAVRTLKDTHKEAVLLMGTQAEGGLTDLCQDKNIESYSPCCDFSYVVQDDEWLPSELPPSYSGEDENVTSVAQTIENAVCSLNAELRELSMKIHDHPELMFEERYAHDLLTRFMSHQGFTVTKHYLGLATAWRAEFSFGSGGRVVGINSEMDALKGMGHGCGHNLIAVSGVGVAIALKSAMETHRIPGKVILLGTPGKPSYALRRLLLPTTSQAEEAGGGKVILLERGAYKEMDVCIMCHPSPGAPSSASIGTTIAMQAIDIEYFGHSAHAGAAPWEGTNALDAAFLAYSSISLLRQQIKPDQRIHGIIQGKDWSPNVIPDYSKMRWLVRARNAAELNSAAALATSCRYEVSADKPYYDLQQNHVLGRAFADIVGTRYGIQTSEAGWTASTDFGNVSYALPALHPAFAIPTVPNGGNHTPAFAKAAATQEAHDAMLLITQGLAVTAYRVLADAQFLLEIQAEFRCSTDSSTASQ
ncbi:hypothetical protein MD484_g1782, partial [Candolleomyces efflorescens]